MTAMKRLVMKYEQIKTKKRKYPALPIPEVFMMAYMRPVHPSREVMTKIARNEFGMLSKFIN